ncbi:hypothetical protein TrLO_g5480 [Triparma laevis f. longispina]|uniref:Dynein axonemal assembly factor 11-like CS domain-containing protein n=1 Tax=Triparma laevis f. longispina TaxID=1714387 RepID=A0A9W6ZA82_9STRA|nr:hypothetical protein TrLO_g5480 [Triparma laevis f. longispina]
MAELTRELLRKRSEHNECMISTMEEISLHQEELTSIDPCLGASCRHLKILLLQNNIIPRMENLHHLKDLQYLNLALNNISKIENLSRCEFLNKLDLTINFIDVDTLEESIDNLVDRSHLKDLYMMGNPAEQEWKGFKSYVVARLPQLGQLDGNEIKRGERIAAQQQLPALVAELRKLAKVRSEKRLVEEVEKAEEKRLKEEKKRRKQEKKEAIEDGRVVVEDVTDDEEEEELTGHTPEVREEIYREMAEQKAEKDAREKENQPKWRGEKDFEAEQKSSVDKARSREERGQIRQCNDGKWKFLFDEETKPGHVILDVSVQKHLSSSLIDVDVHPDYISVVIKSKVLRLVLPAEVHSETAEAKRSKTTGHLVVTMKKVDEKENMIALRAARKDDERKKKEAVDKKERERAEREGGKLGVQMLELSGSVKLEGLVKKKDGGVGVEKIELGMKEVSTKITKEKVAKEAAEEEESSEDSGDDDEPPPIF